MTRPPLTPEQPVPFTKAEWMEMWRTSFLHAHDAQNGEGESARFRIAYAALDRTPQEPSR